jgi:signal transduction histidine kinase
MSAEISEVVVIVLAGTFLMLLLVVFIVSFFFIHQRRQQKHLQEKAILKAQYEQEIITSQNEIQEETMRYISRELHDNVVQMLVLTKIQLNNCETENAKIDNSKAYLNTAITDLRNLSKILNTENILHEGLANAIAFEVNRIQKNNDFHIVFDDTTKYPSLDPKNEIVVFRIFQELLQNIIKHAETKNIRVLLEENGNFLKLELQDDGIGFDFKEKLANKGFEGGSGLSNMIYRAKLLHGSLTVSKNEGNGSISTLTIPLLQKYD